LRICAQCDQRQRQRRRAKPEYLFGEIHESP
jgi:hypothetical protein